MLDIVRNLLQNNMKLEPISVSGLTGFIRFLDNPKDIFDEDFPIGWVNFYRIDDYSATSYFYLNIPVTVLSELPEVSERVDK